MSLTALGTAANIFGVVTPAKDVLEIIKGIYASIQEVSIMQCITGTNLSDLILGQSK